MKFSILYLRGECKYMNKKYILFILFVIIAYVNTIGNYAFLIGLNWAIKLPNADKNIFDTDSGPSFWGDGVRYSIFQYNTKWKLQRIKELCTYSKDVQVEKQIQELLEELD